ncbi:MAG: hypothetical protein NBV67_11970 [Tagaea sp.]|nr:hypothetical protein [Tagaea sp.]
MSQARYDALVKLAAKRAWDPAELLDGLVPRRPFWLARKRHALIAAQLSHGERAALAAAERLRAHVPAEARAALDAQIAEERRHVDAQERYGALLGDDAPASPALGEALAFLARPDLSPAALALANNLLLEEEALHLHRALAGAIGCPALTALGRAIDRDEHRHVLLGRLILPALLAPLDTAARVAIYRDLRAAWLAVVRALLRDHGGLLPVAGRYDDLDSRWAWRRGRLVASGLLTAEQAEAA